MLNPSQKLAEPFIRTELRDRNGVILVAPAGFGKTHLLKHLIKTTTNYRHILVISETNQAVNLLRKDLGSLPNVEFKTVCSSLNYVLEHKSHGFELVQKNFPDWSAKDLIILDEGSQLGKARLAEILALSKKIIICGDDCQAPPVGELESPAFIHPTFKRVSLTIPMRNTTEIFSFCQELRAIIGTNKIFPKTFQISENAFNKKIEESLLDFSLGNAAILAFSEKGARLRAVQEYNTKIRQALFGAVNLPSSGERIVFKNAYIPFLKEKAVESYRGKEFPLFTNMRGTIVELDSAELRVGKFIIPSLRIKFVSDDYPGVYLFGYTPLCKETYEHVRTAMFAQRDERLKKLFFSLWLNFQPAYATNIYVCQGLSIKKVFIDLKDIMLCTKDNLLLRQKLFYVAASRSVEELYIKA